jgi:hypothetical protein
MASRSVSTTQTTGLTLYAYPDGVSLANWSTSRVAITEQAAPNLGRYAGTLDDSIATLWRLFIGASQPSGWDDAVEVFQLSNPEPVVNVLPGHITQQKAKQGNELIVAVESLSLATLTCYNADGTAQDLSDFTLRFCVSVEDEDVATGQTPVDQIEAASITVSGASDNIATFRYTADMVATPRRLIWSLRDITGGNDVELQGGMLNVKVSANA